MIFLKVNNSDTLKFGETMIQKAVTMGLLNWSKHDYKKESSFDSFKG